MKKILLTLTTIALLSACTANKSTEEETTTDATTDAAVEVTATVTATEENGVYFKFPEDGATLQSPVLVGFGVRGMEVEPAGEVVEGKGHHHIVIDGTFIEEGTIVPANATNIHYGKGQLETQLELEPGTHTLTMQFADGVHKSYGEAWSKTIEITVAPADEPAAE